MAGMTRTFIQFDYQYGPYDKPEKVTYEVPSRDLKQIAASDSVPAYETALGLGLPAVFRLFEADVVSPGVFGNERNSEMFFHEKRLSLFSDFESAQNGKLEGLKRLEKDAGRWFPRAFNKVSDNILHMGQAFPTPAQVRGEIAEIEAGLKDLRASGAKYVVRGEGHEARPLEKGMAFFDSRLNVVPLPEPAAAWLEKSAPAAGTTAAKTAVRPAL